MDWSKPLPVDWARLAAFIDGEGCITLLSKRNNRVGGKRSCVPEVFVSNTDPRPLVWMKGNFGGNVRITKNGCKSQKPLWKWFPCYADIEPILFGCLNYFMIKREQAEIAIAVRQMLSRKKWRGAPITEREKSDREALYKRIHVLNFRGQKSRPSIYDAA